MPSSGSVEHDACTSVVQTTVSTVESNACLDAAAYGGDGDVYEGGVYAVGVYE